ncbi:MAG: hypothetical protein IJG09_04700 [Methanobrevibacter sp.]|nr:hypothetical protein [Methanobrevibacter sp.]
MSVIPYSLSYSGITLCTAFIPTSKPAAADRPAPAPIRMLSHSSIWL